MKRPPLIHCNAAALLTLELWVVGQRDGRGDHYTTVRLLASLGCVRASVGWLEFAGPDCSRLLPPPHEHRARRPGRVMVGDRPRNWAGFDRYWMRTFEAFGSVPSATSYRTPATATLGRTEEVVTAPLWSLAGATGSLPAVRVVRGGRRRWQRHYDSFEFQGPSWPHSSAVFG